MNFFELVVLIFIVSTAIDVLSTSWHIKTALTYLKNRDLRIKAKDIYYKGKKEEDFELNPIAKMFINRFGVDKGLTLLTLITRPLIILFFYKYYAKSIIGLLIIFGTTCVYLGFAIRQLLTSWFDRKLMRQALESN